MLKKFLELIANYPLWLVLLCSFFGGIGWLLFKTIDRLLESAKDDIYEYIKKRLTK